MSSRIDNIAVYETHQQKAAVCYCPACLGLQCLERPRYFAGQLLTEAELNSEQAYVIAKNKLHNRYLHGWGVVCGLQVVCHDCDGWVTVKQGYAIDPCGNDIIVCDDQDFDVLKAIRECREGRRRRRRLDCDPVKPPDDKTCKDVEEYWCITIEYAEKEAHPTTALRNELKKGKCGCGCGSSCGCGCGGGGNGNGKSKGKSCGCGCQGGKGVTTSTQGGTGPTNAQCEPTRIFEQYCLNVVEEPEHCGTRHLKHNRYDLRGDSSLGRYMSALGIAKSQQSTVSQVLGAIPQDSLFARILCCLLCLAEFIEKRLSAEDLSLLRDIIPHCRRGGSDSNFPPEAVHSLCCRLYQLVYDLYSENPLNVRCDYNCPPCPPAQNPDDTGLPANSASALASICCLVERLVQYAADCICLAFLPPCPANPLDDRLILACLTIKNGKIIHICNFSCRHYAGSFPSLYYWLSLVPIIPIFGKVLQYICCNENLMRTMFAAYQPDDDFRALRSDVTDDERREVKRRSISDAIRNFIMRSFSYENLADVLKGKETPSPEEDLKDLKEQLEALKVEVDNLRRGGHT